MAEIYFATAASFPGGFTVLILTMSLSQTWASSASLLRSGFPEGACARAPDAPNTINASVKSVKMRIRLARCNMRQSSERIFSELGIDLSYHACRGHKPALAETCAANKNFWR